MNYILYDDAARARLLPFTHTRPVADIRCGIMTMRERWEKCLNVTTTGSLTENYLQQVFPLNAAEDNIYINASVFANAGLAGAINRLLPDHALVSGNTVIAARPAKKTE